MNTIENNKIIAGFMGKEVITEQDFLSYTAGTMTNKTVIDVSLKYHNDWNLLMEVVEKIEGLYFIFSIHHEVVNIFNGETKQNGIYNETFQAQTKIEAVYNACLEFIKWRNQQKTESNEQA